MAVNIAGLRRNIKNVAHNYTDAQVKVREATSNDPWGPSSTMMSEIADLTYNVVAFSEIMQMIWKRLNDQGKNWRHVYKALVLLEYLIKTGSEKVAQQCKENIFAIQTLKDFQYLDDNKDQGINVREKAKSLVALLKDDERLRNERVRALKAKERFAQSTAGIGNNTVYNHNRERYEHQQRVTHRSPSGGLSASELSNPELEAARPQTAGEEELQLQLALAMSREEAEQEESKTKSDDMRLQLALQRSQEETEDKRQRERPSNDLLDLDFGNPAQAPAASNAGVPAVPVRTEASLDPWGMPKSPPKNDPWAPSSSSPTSWDAPEKNDPWAAPAQAAVAPPPAASRQPQVSPVYKDPSASAAASTDNDPWTAVKSKEADFGVGALSLQSHLPEGDDLFSPQAQHQLAEFDLLRSEIEKESGGEGNNGSFTHSNNGGQTSPNPFDVRGHGGLLDPMGPTNGNNSVGGAKPKKTVQNLLGEHSNLVNLDNLVSGTNQARNPFEQQQNPFQKQTQKPAMKELMSKNVTQNWDNQRPNGNSEAHSEINPFF